MAKNLKTRVKNFFDMMNQDEIKETTNQPEVEPALAEAHNPDLGTAEIPAEQAEPMNEEDKWKLEAADWKDKYLRLFAEFDNFRKRSMKERSELLSTASSDIIKEFLPILDDFDRAVKANETVDDVAIVREGFVLIHQKMYRKLESKGLKPIESKGKPFDTDFHEAITQIPAPTPDLVGAVVDEVERGYLLNDKVIRFTKVVIGQ
jgi:molecular chaperone GrpE